MHEEIILSSDQSQTTRSKQYAAENQDKITMHIAWTYQSGISLASMSEAKHKCRNSSGVLKETRTKNFRLAISQACRRQCNTLGNACYTKNDNYALNSWCFEKEGETLKPWLFDGKIENPWMEAKTKQVPEVLVLKTETKFFWEVQLSSQRWTVKVSQYLPCQPY